MKTLLKQAGLTQTQLAQKVGYDHNTISRMALGRIPVNTAVRAYLELYIKCKDIVD